MRLKILKREIKKRGFKISNFKARRAVACGAAARRVKL
ncbi:hypothetical protein CAMGR0001_2248 [Campylobacter gracilis RM3268]|uniref:Uncharacterized protein n=1 Tax=Campylobacter gracilis RM3268 TaxID=553220 RepID=C8PH60_9BACT|nr:hypothetical protein CAMGR0001_2248 [Campylobacter gracilis RM3268]